MGFFCLIGAFMIHFNELRLEKTAQLVSYIVQFLSFLNLIFHASRRLLRLYNTIFDGPGRKRYSQQDFSRRGDGFEKKSNRKAMNRNWSNQKANPALKTKAGNK